MLKGVVIIVGTDLTGLIIITNSETWKCFKRKWNHQGGFNWFATAFIQYRHSKHLGIELEVD